MDYLSVDDGGERKTALENNKQSKAYSTHVT